MNNRLRFFWILLYVLPLASAHAGYSVTNNAAISGHNKKKVSGGLDACKKACDNERSFFCKSFDYVKRNGSCDLSDKTAEEVGGLKTDYSGNPYDHYARTFVAQKPLREYYRVYEIVMECFSPSIQDTGSKNALSVDFVTSSGQTYKGKKIMQPYTTCNRGQKVNV